MTQIFGMMAHLDPILVHFQAGDHAYILMKNSQEEILLGPPWWAKKQIWIKYKQEHVFAVFVDFSALKWAVRYWLRGVFAVLIVSSVLDVRVCACLCYQGIFVSLIFCFFNGEVGTTLPFAI